MAAGTRPPRPFAARNPKSMQSPNQRTVVTIGNFDGVHLGHRRLVEEDFRALKAPPLRLAALDLPVPFAPELEQAFRPGRDSVIERLTAWIG